LPIRYSQLHFGEKKRQKRDRNGANGWRRLSTVCPSVRPSVRPSVCVLCARKKGMRAGAEGGHIRDYLRNDRSIARMHARRRESARLVARLQACMHAQSPPRLSQCLWSVAGAWYAAPFYLPPFSFSLSLLPSSFLSFFRSFATTNKQTNKWL
jgi:hypothetical protein